MTDRNAPKGQDVPRFVATDLDPPMRLDPIGAWVHWDDYAAAHARIEALEVERAALIEGRDMMGRLWEKEKARAEQAEAEVKRLREYYAAAEAIISVEAEWKARKADGGLLSGPNIFNLTDKLTQAEARLAIARAALTEGGKATTMRCAECDCKNGGADCNWIKSDAGQKGGE